MFNIRRHFERLPLSFFEQKIISVPILPNVLISPNFPILPNLFGKKLSAISGLPLYQSSGMIRQKSTSSTFIYFRSTFRFCSEIDPENFSEKNMSCFPKIRIFFKILNNSFSYYSFLKLFPKKSNKYDNLYQTIFEIVEFLFEIFTKPAFCQMFRRICRYTLNQIFSLKIFTKNKGVIG